MTAYELEPKHKRLERLYAPLKTRPPSGTLLQAIRDAMAGLAEIEDQYTTLTNSRAQNYGLAARMYLPTFGPGLLGWSEFPDGQEAELTNHYVRFHNSGAIEVLLKANRSQLFFRS